MNKLLQLDFRRLNLGRFDPRRRAANVRQPGGAVLGLVFDGSRVEGVEVRRTNGSVEIRKAFTAALSLNLLTAEPDLVGRELRKHLDAAGVRERRCVVGLPLSWALTLAVPLPPELAGPDVQSLLQLEAERGLPYAPEELQLATSQARLADGRTQALLVAIPREPIARLEAVLAAAQLRPASFSLGLAALQPAAATEGVIALWPGETNLCVQITCGGGVVVLRTVEGAFEVENGEPRFQLDQVARELRITLGELLPTVREAVKRVRVFGPEEVADEIIEQLRPRANALGLQVEKVSRYATGDFAVQMPAAAPVSPALSLATRLLSGAGMAFEFLPERISAWRRFTAQYSSGRLALAGMAVGAVILLLLLVFGVQQAQMWYWGGKWSAMKPRVQELEAIQANIRKYRPWFDDSVKSLAILRRLTEAFPQDGAVSAKTVEFREPATVTCSGTARDNTALLRTLDNLRATPGVNNVKLEQIRGRAPMQFTFNFQWGEGGTR